MSTHVPQFTLAPEVESLGADIRAAIERVLDSTSFILGAEVTAFEQEVATYLGVEHAVGVNSGTDALTIALRAMGVGPGHEVIVPSFTFVATAEAVESVGATPVFVDVEADGFNITPATVEAAINDNTRAIIPVHLFGQPVDMQSLRQLTAGRDIWLLEDAAQAFGATRGHAHVGSLGHAAGFSFFPTKNLGAYGDAGLLATNEAGIAERARALRTHGARVKGSSSVVGYNSRLDELHASILRVKLPHVDAANRARRAIAARYTEALSDIEGVIPPSACADGTHVYHQYTLRIPGGGRDRVRAQLARQGVQTAIYYAVPVHRQPLYVDRNLHLPCTEALAGEVLSLPMWPQMPAPQVERVIAALRTALKGH